MISVSQIGSRSARHLARRWAEQLRLPDDPWSALQAELDLWRGPPLTFWWRDDDAISDTPPIRRLLDNSSKLGVPIALAVIPAHVNENLQWLLRDHPTVGVLGHGWSHQNHAAPGEPKAELAASRNAGEVFSDLSNGRHRLQDLFGSQFWPVCVPPFNLLAPKLVPVVIKAGYSYLSIDRDFAKAPLPVRNCHLDVIDWGNARAAEPASVIRSAVVALRLRRYGLVRPGTPIGVITHHLVHDTEIWRLTEDLLRRLALHPAVTFPLMQEIFP